MFRFKWVYFTHSGLAKKMPDKLKWEMKIMIKQNNLENRIVAFLIDYIFINLILTIIILGIPYIVSIIINITFNLDKMIEIYAVISIITIFIYCVIFEYKINNSSIGKKKLDLIIVSKKGDNVKLWQIILRNIIKLSPIAFNYYYTLFAKIPKSFIISQIPISYFMMLLSFIIVAGSMFLTKEKVGIHNVISGLRIVTITD